MTVKEYNSAVRELGDRLYRFVLGIIKDSHRADDIVQDSYEKLWRNVTTIEYGAVKAWLFRTAYNRTIDIIRRESRMIETEQIDDTGLFADEADTDLNEILHKALERLPTVQQSVILLRDYEGYSYREIGTITGLSEAQVKSYIHRGRVALRNLLIKTSIWQ